MLVNGKVASGMGKGTMNGMMVHFMKASGKITMPMPWCW